MIYKNRSKWGSIWFVVLLGLLGCGIAPSSWIAPLDSMPTPVAETPTPQYTPMAGRAYVISSDQDAPLLAEPSYVGAVKGDVATDTQIDIIDAVWFYQQNRHGETACYIYHVRVLGTQVEGWLAQSNVTLEKGIQVPDRTFCAYYKKAYMFTPTPAYSPLEGPVYVNVGEGYGIYGSLTAEPRIGGSLAVLAHGLRVKIIQAQWISFKVPKSSAWIACYMYQVEIPNTSVQTWLPEDAITQSITDIPQKRCFPSSISPEIRRITEISNGRYQIYTPEPDQP
jgi:hypothetical protein